MKVKILIPLLYLSCMFFLTGCNGINRSVESSDLTLLDVHGAGAQRSDPKTGNPDNYPEGHGPQGDVVRIYNYVRPVRDVSATTDTYPIVDTAQILFFDNSNELSTTPSSGADFYGQDAHYSGLEKSYTDNDDGTISDNMTGLMWQQDPGDKMTQSVAESSVGSLDLGGHTDWRIPTVKELYSLIIFSGRDVSVAMNDTGYLEEPFIDTDYFVFEYGDTDAGERNIDAQYLSSTEYVSTTMNGDATVFGVNFADGRIKGYPIFNMADRTENEFFVIFVRGNESYGENSFTDNGDGTVSDNATGLMWLEDDSTYGMDWDEALDWAEDLTLATYSDWRLPNAKELQSLIDYSRSPDTHDSAAIDPVFNCTSIADEDGYTNYPFYWTSTTHADCYDNANYAVYLAFGEALGYMDIGD